MQNKEIQKKLKKVILEKSKKSKQSNKVSDLKKGKFKKVNVKK